MNIIVESIIALVTDPRAIRESNDSKVYTYTNEATMLTRRFSNSNKWMKQRVGYAASAQAALPRADRKTHPKLHPYSQTFLASGVACSSPV